MVRRLLPVLGLIAAGLLAVTPAYAIKGGRTADTNKWKWAVALLYDGDFECGGSLINRRWVLTAAHCATEHPSRITAVVGSHNRNAGTRIDVVRVYRHPDWQGRTHDVALLRLASPAPAELGMVSVPDNAIHNRIAPAGTTATAVGWGNESPGSFTSPVALRQVDLPLEPASQCRSVFSTLYDANAHLCTQTSDKGICVFDSGGPLVVNDGGADYQIGISSFAESEDGRTLQCVESGFTRVASYTDWMNRILAMRPSAPVALKAVAGDAQVGLIWETPSGPFIESYEVRHRTADGSYSAWTAIAGSSAATTAHRVPGLTNGTTYAFQVRARNEAGPGAKARVFGTPQAGDAMPTFGNATVADQTWIVNVITTRTLPEAAGGDGALTYHLTPSPPAGMTYTASTHTLSGTPTTSAGTVAYTWTATDADGDTADLSFGITVTPAFCARQNGGEFVSMLSDTAMCSDALPESLVLTLQAAVLDNFGIRSLPSDIFAGLTWLRRIYLSDNLLTSLPDGLFDGLGNLQLLQLHGNTGSPFTLNVVAQRSGSQARAYLAQAAPRSVHVTWTASGGSTATGTAIIPAGERYSAPFGAAAAQAVTLTLSTPTLDGVSESTSDSSGSYSGFQLAVPSTSAAVTIPGAPVDLSGLTISQGTLDPAFGSGTTAYAASVGNGVTSLTVTPSVSDPSMATIRVNGAAVSSGTAHSVPLDVGENTIPVVVAEQGGTTTKTYTVTVTRASPTPSSDAGLSGLTLSHGTLSPTFAAAETAYTVEVPYGVASLAVTPTATDSDHATITVDGVPEFSGDPSDGIDLRVGANAIPIVVTAQDGTTMKAYTVTVTRLARPVVLPPPDRQPRFGDVTVAAQRYMVGTAIPPLVLPAATGGDAPLSYALTPALPAGLRFDEVTRVVAGTPAAEQAETTYTWTATDADGDTARLPFTVEVAPDFMPTFGDAAVEAQRYQVGTSIELTLPEATGGDGALSYRLTPALPAGLRFDEATRTVSGTPAADQAETLYTWTAADMDGDMTSLPFTIEIEPDSFPTFGETTVPAQRYHAGTAIAEWVLPEATDGNGTLRYALAPALPAGLGFDEATRVVSGTPIMEMAETSYTWMATDADGDTASLTFTVEVLEPITVSIFEADALEGGPVEFKVGLSAAAESAVTLTWTTAAGTATPGEDYTSDTENLLRIPAGRTEALLRVQTLDDRHVKPAETFTVTLLDVTNAKLGTNRDAGGTITDDDTPAARRRALGMVLAGVGRTIAADTVDVIGSRFEQRTPAAQATLGGESLSLQDGGGQWHHAVGLAYGVARALGVEVVSPLASADGPFGQVRGAAWSTLTRHLTGPRAPTGPVNGQDASGVFAVMSRTDRGRPLRVHSIPPLSSSTGSGAREGLEPALDTSSGGLSSAWGSGAGDTHFGNAYFPGSAGSGPGLGQGGTTFDSAFQSPVRFRRVSAMEMVSRSRFDVPLGTRDPEGWMSGWTLWGRGTASGFDGQPKDDFSMGGNVFTGYLGLDYRLQKNVLLGLAVAHSRGDMGYETTDVTEGEVDIALTSVLPYAHWSPRPGLGVWGLLGAGWGNLDLEDEAGKVQTGLELLMAAVGARQELLTRRRIDVALKADAFLTELEAASDDKLPKTAGDAQRLRLMVEGRTAWALSDASHLTPMFEIGGRWDGGKAETGVGAELGGGLEYKRTRLGLGIEARGRYLLAHQKSAFDEWGASLTLKFDPGADKRGVWLALAPVWGAEASRIERMCSTRAPIKETPRDCRRNDWNWNGVTAW